MQLRIKLIGLIFIFIQVNHLNARPSRSHKPHKKLDHFINPVILTPGVAGSQLVAKLNKQSVPHYYCQKQSADYFNIWLNLELILPLIIDCFVDNVKLQYDNKTRTTSNQNGVDIQITEFGNTSTIEYINPSRIRYTVYFDPIVQSLTSYGYEVGKNLFGTPYDFRKSPGELVDFYQNLDKIILSSYKNNGNLPVHLVCHSMGCLMIYMHLNEKSQDWKDKYIKSLITLGAPWGGSVKSVKEIVSGDNLGVSYMSQTAVRDISRTFPSIPFLFPKKGFWREDEPFVTRALNTNRNITYTSSNYEDLFNDLNLPDTFEMYKDVSALIKTIRPPNVELHCFHGYGLPTPDSLHFEKGKFPDSPTVLNGDGDGTVNIRSLEYCRYWKGRQKKIVTYKKFENVEHMQTVSNADIVKQVFESITGIDITDLKVLFKDDQYLDKNVFSLKLSAAQELKKMNYSMIKN